MRMVSTGTLAALARLPMVNEFASSDICLDSVVDYGFKLNLSNKAVEGVIAISELNSESQSGRESLIAGGVAACSRRPVVWAPWP